MKAGKGRHEPKFKARAAIGFIKSMRTFLKIAKEYQIHPSGLIVEIIDALCLADLGERNIGTRCYNADMARRVRFESTVAPRFYRPELRNWAGAYQMVHFNMAALET